MRGAVLFFLRHRRVAKGQDFEKVDMNEAAVMPAEHALKELK